MNILLSIIVLTTHYSAQTGTVPGTFPPVPKKYWVPVQQPTPATVEPTGRRMTITKGRKQIDSDSGDKTDYGPMTESGIVRWSGSKNFHVVKNGETLWDLAKKYFGNNWIWPRLWSWNPHITNPHWLFPGTRIWLTGSQRVKKAVSSRPGFFGLSVTSGTVRLKRKGFIQEEELAKSSVVIGSAEEKTLLSVGDIIYLKQPEDEKKKFIVGERYMVYRPTEKILYKPTKKPKKGSKKKKEKPEKIGRLVQILGEVIIREVRPKKVLRAQIVSSLYTIKRKDKVGTPLTTYNNVTPRPVPLEKRVVGKIIHAIENRAMLSPGSIVLIDLGTDKGMSRGAVLKILIRGDGLYANLHPMDPGKKNDKAFPYESKGTLIVFHATKYYSLAMISKTEKAVNIGDVIAYGDFPDRKKPDDEKSATVESEKYEEVE